MTDGMRGPKFRRRAEKRPDEVLDAALALFVENGLRARASRTCGAGRAQQGRGLSLFPSKEAILEGLVRRAVLPIATNALGALADVVGKPRPVIHAVLKMVAGRRSEPQTLAIARLLIREMIHFPQFAALYRREVLDHIIPAVEQLVARGVAEGYFRPVDPNLTIRSIIGPLIVHMLMAEVFGIVPEGGLGIDRLVDNHLDILFDGLSAPASDKRFMAT